MSQFEAAAPGHDFRAGGAVFLSPALQRGERGISENRSPVGTAPGGLVSGHNWQVRDFDPDSRKWHKRLVV